MADLCLPLPLTSFTTTFFFFKLSTVLEILSNFSSIFVSNLDWFRITSLNRDVFFCSSSRILFNVRESAVTNLYNEKCD